MSHQLIKVGLALYLNLFGNPVCLVFYLELVGTHCNAIFGQIWPNAHAYNIHDPLHLLLIRCQSQSLLVHFLVSIIQILDTLNYRMYVNIWKRRGEIKKKKLGKMLRRHAAKSFWMDENWVFELAILGVGTNLFLSWILLQKNRENRSFTKK